MVIYKTTNLLNGKIYIGQDSKNDPDYFGSGLKLDRAIKKHGKDNFKKEILEVCENREQLNLREIYWIRELNSLNPKIGYNLTEGGTGGNIYKCLTEEKKRLGLEKRKTTLQKRTEEEKQKTKKLKSQRMKEIWKNPKHKEKIREMMEGRDIWWNEKISKSLKEFYQNNPQKKPSDETRQKISEKMSGYEFKSVSEDIQNQIVELYQTIGPKLIADRLNLSLYLVRRVLKSKGIYKKFQKGIGPVELRNSSISRKGEGNPMFGRRKPQEVGHPALGVDAGGLTERT